MNNWNVRLVATDEIKLNSNYKAIFEQAHNLYLETYRKMGSTWAAMGCLTKLQALEMASQFNARAHWALHIYDIKAVVEEN